ncbi:MAG TPA: tyrosine-type recombinase/integrase [Chloroflexota bacterium]|nr:tyrosine-type recombinase/integrase [Chloroflexota bacterium]
MARRRLPKCLAAGEPERLVRACTTDRDRLLVECGLFLGLRVSELVHLQIEEVDLDARRLLVNQGKGGKDRYVPIPQKLMAALAAWIGKRTAGPVFLSRLGRGLTTRAVQQMLQAAGERAGLPRRVTPHMLRHTYATRLLERGATLREVQELLGHSSVATTERYTWVLTDRLRGAVDRL